MIILGKTWGPMLLAPEIPSPRLRLPLDRSLVIRLSARWRPLDFGKRSALLSAGRVISKSMDVFATSTDTTYME